MSRYSMSQTYLAGQERPVFTVTAQPGANIFGNGKTRRYAFPAQDGAAYGFRVPVGVKILRVYVHGGGGSGASSDVTDSRCCLTGGGGGGLAMGYLDVSAMNGMTIPVIVGAGGVTEAYASNGTTGGTSSFMGISATGGGGGRYEIATTVVPGGVGGMGFGGVYQAPGGNGGRILKNTGLVDIRTGGGAGFGAGELNVKPNGDVREYPADVLSIRTGGGGTGGGAGDINITDSYPAIAASAGGGSGGCASNITTFLGTSHGGRNILSLSGEASGIYNYVKQHEMDNYFVGSGGAIGMHAGTGGGGCGEYLPQGSPVTYINGGTGGGGGGGGGNGGTGGGGGGGVSINGAAGNGGHGLVIIQW